MNETIKNENDLVKIENKDGKLMVSSRVVADRFEKQHKHVLESIENIRAENSALTSEYFIETSYKAGTGKHYKEYLLTRDGFFIAGHGLHRREGSGLEIEIY